MKKILIQIITLIAIISSGALAHAQAEALQPSLEITSPIKGDSYGGDPVELHINVKNFIFVSYKNFTVLFPGNPNAGHAHMWINPPQIGGDSDTVYEIESPDFHQFGALERGGYNIIVELVKNDHTPFSPRVHEEVSFLVTEETSAGKYAVVKTESVENVGGPPTNFRFIIIFSTAFIILLIAILTRHRKKGIIKSIGKKFYFINRIGGRIIATTKRIYIKLRRNIFDNN